MGLGKTLGKANDAANKAQKLKDLTISEADERKIGEQVSAKVRTEYGVFQDKAVTKYVSLVGMALAKASTRPDLKWEFIVLDTDGVNAFASPGGLVHITRGRSGPDQERGGTRGCARARSCAHHEETHRSTRSRRTQRSS